MPESSKGKGLALRNGKRQYLAGDDKVVLSLYLGAASKLAPGVCDRQKARGVCLQNAWGWFIRALTLRFPVGAKHWQKQCDPLAILSALCYPISGVCVFYCVPKRPCALCMSCPPNCSC